MKLAVAERSHAGRLPYCVPVSYWQVVISFTSHLDAVKCAVLFEFSRADKSSGVECEDLGEAVAAKIQDG